MTWKVNPVNHQPTVIAAAPDELLGIDEKTGKSPESRLTSAITARTIVGKLRQEDEPRSRQRALVKGMIDGNPPYSAAARKLHGSTWTSNLNFMEGEAIIETARTPYYQLFNGVTEYAEIKTAHDPKNADQGMWSASISKRFHSMLSRWSDFNWHMQHKQWQMLTHGIGPVFFPRTGDWRFRSAASGSLKAPQRSASCLDKRVPFVAVDVDYTVLELWEFVRDEKRESGSKGVGWNADALKDAIKKHGQKVLGGSDAWNNAAWETYQQKLKNNDLDSYACDVIKCSHVFVQEFNGKISHFIVTDAPLFDDKTGGADAYKEKNDQFLFRSPNRFDSYDQALVVFFQNIGDGTWHSVRGLGAKAFKHIEASNRLKNKILDGAFLSATPLLQMETTTTADKLQAMVVRPDITWVPPGAKVLPGQLSGFMDGPMTADRLLTNHLQGNIGMFNSRTLSREDGKGEMPTAYQVSQQVAKEASLSQGQIMLYYLTLDKLYSEMYRRASDPSTSDEEAKRFQQECKEDGVPKEALKNVEFVRANRASGYGSPAMRQLTDEQMLKSGAVAAMPPEGQQNFWRSYTSGVKGADKTDQYFPRERIPVRHDWEAQMENMAMASGVQAMKFSGQDDVIHLESHLAFADERLSPLSEAVAAGEADPAALDDAHSYVLVLVTHLEEHMAGISADQQRSGLLKLFKQKLSNILSFRSELRTAMIRAQQEAKQLELEGQNAMALGAMDQAKLNSVKVQDEIKTFEAQRDAERRDFKVREAAKLQTFKVATSTRLSSIKTAAEIDRARAQKASQQPAEAA